MSDEGSCPLCGGSLAVAVERPRSSYAPDGTYRIDACASCGAGTTMPRPTPDELDACYESTYGYSTHDLIEHEKRRRAGWLLRWSGVTAGRVLDVGCMFGFLLDEAKRAGLETHGIELASGPADVARAKGHAVWGGTLEGYAAANPDERFDAIFAQHVIEHVADPRSFLRVARALLRDGGKLVACVPNFDARLRRLAPRAWGWYQVPVHLHHYSSRALQTLLREAGFSVDTVKTRGGDTLFLALSALQLFGVSPGAAASSGRPGLARTALRVVGEITRPYYSLGDDELAIIALA